ncbi:MAG: hypothetical protein EXR69_09245 [Myxococcales bacterium]|nr:hypothetical protein [Myxococcales bacterium]
MRIAIRSPDHLGDAVMALPAMAAIVDRYPETTIHGPPVLGALLAATAFPTVLLRAADQRAEADVAVILKPSFRAAWQWRHIPRRLGLAENHRAALLTDPLPAGVDEHRRDGYARVAQALLGQPAQRKPEAYRRAATAAGFIALNPWSPSPTVRWPHYRALADDLSRDFDVRFFAGPGEQDAVAHIAGPHPLTAGLPLIALAAALGDARLFVSNDSGAAHFAEAVGAPVLMIHGSTDPARTGAGVALTGGPIWCGPCYRKSCFLGVSCLQRITAVQVASAVRRALAGDSFGLAPPR